MAAAHPAVAPRRPAALRRRGPQRAAGELVPMCGGSENACLAGKAASRPQLRPCSAGVAASRRPSADPLLDITNLARKAEEAAKAEPPRQQEPQVVATPPVPGWVPAVDAASEAAEEDKLTNVQHVTEYVADVTSQLFVEEARFLPRPDYMDTQTDITSKMRTILLDWLVEVHMKYRLRSETLHLAVNLVDRYLTLVPVNRKRLQLVGVVGMLIAAKFEEISPPPMQDWVYITDNAYTKEDVLKMECDMLATLSFQIMVPTAAHFLPYLQKVNGCSDVHGKLAEYILEVGMLDMRTLQYIPSHVVSAALLLSNEILGRCPAWPANMAKASGCSDSALRGCTEVLKRLLAADQGGAAGQQQAVYKKYSSPRFHSVAALKF